jgi:hypothetical protein
VSIKRKSACHWHVVATALSSTQRPFQHTLSADADGTSTLQYHLLLTYWTSPAAVVVWLYHAGLAARAGFQAEASADDVPRLRDRVSGL